MSRHPDPSIKDSAHLAQSPGLDWRSNPTVLIVAVGIIFTVFYQSLHSSPYHRHRHPGELLWDVVVSVTPAALLYTIDDLLNPPMFPTAKTLRPRTFAAKSELLRRLLGMDQPGGGIIGSVTSAGRKSLSTLSGGTLLKRDCNKPPGLGNTDYSCFQNSILQGLTSLQPLPNYLASAASDPAGTEADSNQSSASTLQQLIAQLKDPENNGKTLWTPAKLKSLHSWEQQDAQEYFSKLLDEIEKEVNKASKTQHKPLGLESALAKDDTESHYSDDSGYQSLTNSSKTSSEAKIVRNPLEGMTAQRVACVQCGHSEGLSLQPFSCITLNLGVGTTQHDLYELLDSYTQLEFIEQVECNKCTLLRAKELHTMVLEHKSGKPEIVLQQSKSRLEAVEQALEDDDFEERTLKEKCKISAQHRSSSTKTKQVVIARPPRSLAIHVNRSVFDFNTGNMWKNLAAVRFPRTLDLGPWCLGSADQTVKFRKQTLIDVEKDELTRDQETWVSDPKSSMVSGDHYPSKISGPIYELRAVVTHQGQHENGHYVCFRKHSSTLSQRQQQSSSEKGNDESQSLDGEETLVEFDEESSDKWWRLSDENVWDVTEEDVLGQGGVFMLFYDCVDYNSVLSTGLSSNGEEIKEVVAKDELLATPQALQISAVDENAVSTDTFEDPSITSRLDDANPPTVQQEAHDAFKPVTSPDSMFTNRKVSSDAIDVSKNDTFVYGLLHRPNSVKGSEDALEKACLSPFLASNSATGKDVSDSFVLSLLNRPNA
jgi:ubiquitin carboxyl-terminal hydrolase 1